MITKSVYLLNEVLTLPTTQIGSWAALLGGLVQQKIPLTGGFVIPITTLLQIAKTNQLAKKIADLDITDISSPKQRMKIRAVFAQLSIDPAIGHAWLKAFYHSVGDHPAFISTSWSHVDHPLVQRTGVKGDANVLETILELWAETYVRQFDIAATTDSLSPAAIVVQAQPKPQAYGLVKTRIGPAHYKAVVSVQANRLPLEQSTGFDEYKVDVRTWHVIESHVLRPDQPALEIDQVILAAQAGYQAKLLQFEHGELEWTINHLHLTPVAYTTEFAQNARAIAQTDTRTVLSGKSLIPGIVQGNCVLVKKNIPGFLKPDTIVVAESLTYIPPTALKYINGLIVENTLPAPVLNQLLAFHIPTVIQVRGASRQLKPNQRIYLDAVQGTIRPDTQSVPAASPLKTKLVIETPLGLTNQLAQLNPTDILLKPDQILAQFGVHPLHFIRTKDRELLFQLLSQKVQSFRSMNHLIYKTANLSTADLAQLQFGGQFEVGERNPDLGYHGALRSISQPELLDFELDVLAHAHRLSHQQISLLISGVRSPSEYKLVSQHVQAKLPDATWLSTWLEISTPEGAINHFAYQHLSLQGIVINLPRLHALSHGIDPYNQDIYRLYPWNVSLLKHFIQHVFREAGTVPCYAVCPTDQPQIIEAAIELGVAGVIVKPYYVTRAKEYMMRAEHQLSTI